jgi:archaeosine synthase
MNFQIKRIDASARIGKLGNLETPAVLHHKKIKKFLEDHGIEIPEIMTPFSVAPFEIQNETSLVHPKKIEKRETELLILCSSSYMSGKGRELFETMEKLKKTLKPNTAIYLPALATPENIALLIFLGADVFDDLKCLSSAMKGEYLTRDGTLSVSNLERFPCSCPICSSYTTEELESNWRLIYSHNFNALLNELENVKIFIRKGMLREYVSKQCRTSPWLTVALRLYDGSEYYFKRVPIRRTSQFYANSSEEIQRAEIRRFASRVLERYYPKSKILLLLPCSAVKPYSLSPSHRRIIKSLGKLRRGVDELIITSPLGIVPRFLETVYPAMHYDIPVTGRWDEEEKKWASSLLREFVERNQYERIFAYVEGDYREVCTLSEIEIEFFNTLEELRKELESEIEDVPTQKSYMRAQISSIADYQFGKGTGEKLVKDAEIRGRYPKLDVMVDGKKLASLQGDGMLSLSVLGGERLKGLKDYTVIIDDFIPSGSILSPGVLEAGKEILSGDEVLFENSRVFGVGRAVMCSEDMLKASYGVAINVREKVVKE